ncbi:PREDICTED: putative, partial [Prunus dulcis]
HVKFEYMDKLKCVGVEFYGAALFPSLKTELRNAPSRFPSLQKLEIRNIDQVMAIENICIQLTTLTHLKIHGATELTRLPVGMLENNHNLRVMHIDDCNKLSHLPDGLHALRLRIVKIQNCEKLSSWPSGLKYCTSLQELHITNCQNLRHLPVDALQNPVSLKELYIVDCTNLEAVPSLDNLTSLHDVPICGCDGLTSLPRGLRSLTSLENLSIGELLMVHHNWKTLFTWRAFIMKKAPPNEVLRPISYK